MGYTKAWCVLGKISFFFFFPAPSFYWGIIDKQNCKTFKVYMVVIWYTYTWWKDSHHLGNISNTSHIYLYFLLRILFNDYPGYIFALYFLSFSWIRSWSQLLNSAIVWKQPQQHVNKWAQLGSNKTLFIF